MIARASSMLCIRGQITLMKMVRILRRRHQSPRLCLLVIFSIRQPVNPSLWCHTCIFVETDPPTTGDLCPGICPDVFTSSGRLNESNISGGGIILESDVVTSRLASCSPMQSGWEQQKMHQLMLSMVLVLDNISLGNIANLRLRSLKVKPSHRRTRQVKKWQLRISYVLL